MINREPEERSVLFSIHTEEGEKEARRIRDETDKKREAAPGWRLARRLGAQVLLLNRLLANPATGLTENEIALTLRGILGDAELFKPDVELTAKRLHDQLFSIAEVDRAHS